MNSTFAWYGGVQGEEENTPGRKREGSIVSSEEKREQFTFHVRSRGNEEERQFSPGQQRKEADLESGSTDWFTKDLIDDTPRTRQRKRGEVNTLVPAAQCYESEGTPPCEPPGPFVILEDGHLPRLSWRNRD